MNPVGISMRRVKDNTGAVCGIKVSARTVNTINIRVTLLFGEGAIGASKVVILKFNRKASPEIETG